METGKRELLRGLPAVDAVMRDPSGLTLADTATAGPRLQRPSARRSTDCGAGSSPVRDRRSRRGPSSTLASSLLAGRGLEARRQRDGRDPAHQPRALGPLGACDPGSQRGGHPLLQPGVRPPLRQPEARATTTRCLSSENLTGAEDALVVNNCAGATLLALSAVVASEASEAPEVIVSRGQLIEIGGGFRIPEVLALSGARLREVGTTNRTRLSDYANAIDENTRAILWVHPSNFETVGFTESVGVADLTSLGLPVIADVGSGALFSVGDEPRVQDIVSNGRRPHHLLRRQASRGTAGGYSGGNIALDLLDAPPSPRPRPPRRQALPRRPRSDPELLPGRHRR